jgi:hypothetical protein
MTVDIPNLADAAFPGQARFFASDIQIMTQAPSLSGIKSGCAVTAQGSPNMTLAVASGVLYWLNAEVTVTAGNVTITTAHATLDRIDLVVASSTGVKSVVAGTAATIPTQPALGATSVALAQVYVPAADTAIGATQVKDRRVVITIPSVIGATTIVRKTADESVTSSTTLQNDNHLLFAAGANTVYAVTFMVMAASTASSAIKFNVYGPAGVVWRANFVSRAGNVQAFSSDGSTGDFVTVGLQATGAELCEMHLIVATVGTAGNFGLSWAQVASSATALRVLTNSYLEYRALP